LVENIMVMNKKNQLFWMGLLIGMLAGIIGNILVNSCFVLITNSCKNIFCYIGVPLLILISLGVLIWIIKFIVRKIKK